MEFSRRDFRVMIWYDWKSKLSAQECHNRVRSAVGERAPDVSTVRNWYREFQRGRTSLDDEFRGGRPTTAVTPENIDAIREMIAENSRITYNDIRASIGIGMTQIHKILHEHLGVAKRCARWIPHNLKEEEKQERVNWCLKMIKKFNQGQSKAVYDIITGDETWIYCYEPESKRQSAQWIFPDEALPTKVKRTRSAGKQMVASFFGRTGHVATVALPLKSTVNAEWYTTICLPEVFRKVREKRPEGNILLHHDNARPHIANRTTEYLAKLRVELLGAPTYSPDLSPCDFFLFPTIKDRMRGLRFDSAEAAVEAYEQLVSEVPPERWSQCFQDWFRRMQKCIDCHGEYFEKQ